MLSKATLIYRRTGICAQLLLGRTIESAVRRHDVDDAFAIAEQVDV
jgi:hypothetical protein